MKFYFLRKRISFVPTSFHHDQGDGYDSNDERIFGYMLSQAKCSEQIVIHITDNRDYIYYLYVCKIGYGWFGIGVKHMEICTDFHVLLDMFRGLVEKLLEWPQPIILMKKNKNRVQLSNYSFDDESDEIMLFKKSYNSFADIPFVNAIRLVSIEIPDESIRSIIKRNLSDVGREGFLKLIKDGCYNIVLTVEPNSQFPKKKKWIFLVLVIMIFIMLLYFALSTPYIKYILIPN